MGFGNILGPISLQQKSLAALPSAVDLRTGTSVEVTNYGGNIATVVNGVWRFEFPFRTTWENRPPANLVPIGTELQVTDYGNHKWISDGANWSPAQGVVVLYDLFGLNDGTGYIARISSATSGTFAIPGGLKIPAGMIRNGTKIFAQVDITKLGGNGTATVAVTLGTLNSASDSSIVVRIMSIGTGMQALISCAARFGSSSTKFNTRDSVGDGVTQTNAANVMIDRTNNININTDMWVNVNISSATAGDGFNLVGIQVKLEA